MLCVLTLALPFGLGWAIGGTWVYGVTALLWAGLVRIALLHHVTWSVNSLCHLIGERPFHTRRHDRATNLWPLALLSFGESWHNLHHADPTCARHGVDRGQIDPSAAVIRVLERLGWVSEVRWPNPSGSRPAASETGSPPGKPHPSHPHRPRRFGHRPADAGPRIAEDRVGPPRRARNPMRPKYVCSISRESSLSPLQSSSSPSNRAGRRAVDLTFRIRPTAAAR